MPPYSDFAPHKEQFAIVCEDRDECGDTIQEWNRSFFVFDFLISWFFFWKKLKIQWKKDGVDYSQIFCQADRSDGCTNYDGWFVCHCSECGLISFFLQFFCERILMKAKLWSQNQKKLFKYYNCRFLTKRLSYLEFMFSSAVFDKITL